MSIDPSAGLPRSFFVVVPVLVMGLWLAAGSPLPAPNDALGSVDVVVVASGEQGQTVEGDVRLTTGAAHRLGSPIPVDQPVLGFVVADGYLPEPVVVSPFDPSPVRVRLLAESGVGGDRRILHFGGDTMVGRRYLEDAAGGIPDEAAARALVADLAPLFGAADLSVLNVESVVGDMAPGGAYPAKRFLVATPEHGVAALEALGVDVATLGNNHAFDWGEAGLRTTVEALAAGGMATVGAGADPDVARAPLIVDVEGLGVAILSYTTVTGDVVNDALPTGDAAVPADLPAEDAWQYEERAVVGTALDWPEGPMRAGDAWRRFDAVEGDLDPAVVGDVWAEMAAVFPELQDWVARRGHGGAAHFERRTAAVDVATARSAGADLVVVALHGGHQYAPVASEYLLGAVDDLVAAGADVVVGHHPHVVQGVALVDGVPVAHSLGNLVFDQDFGATFPSVVMRVVVDDEGVVATRFYPIELVGHRPVPVGGPAVGAALDRLAARSAGGLTATRMGDGTVSLTPGAWPGGGLESVGWGFELTERWDDPTAMGAECELLDRGSFEDVEADGRQDGAGQWSLSDDAHVRRIADAPDGRSVLHLEDSALARPISRIPVPSHRVHDADGAAMDDARSLELRLVVRGRSGGAMVRFDTYRFDDRDPTRAPTSTMLGSVEVPVAVSGEWSEARVAVPSEALDGGANSLLPYLVHEGSPGEWFEVDDVRLVETRPSGVACFG